MLPVLRVRSLARHFERRAWQTSCSIQRCQWPFSTKACVDADNEVVGERVVSSCNKARQADRLQRGFAVFGYRCAKR